LGDAVETLVKGIGTLAPFLAPYPSWVKATFAIFILSGAICLVGLVVAAPRSPEAHTEGSAATPSAWLTIKGITGFGRLADKAVQVAATINGVDYIYPTSPGIEWLQIGPEMAPQTFEIPVRDVYTVKMSAKVRGWSDDSLASVEEQRVAGTTNGVATYSLFPVHLQLRSAAPVAEVRYIISQGHP
jgi:hypothetical protein